MAVVVGTNCGFCADQPTSNPSGSFGPSWGPSRTVINGDFTSPTGSYRVTELGIWLDNQGTNGSTLDLGIYDWDGKKAANLLTHGTVAYAATEQWYRVTLGTKYTLASATSYCLACAWSPTTNYGSSNYAGTAANHTVLKNSTYPLPATNTSTWALKRYIAMYALYEEAPTSVTVPFRACSIIM